MSEDPTAVPAPQAAPQDASKATQQATPILGDGPSYAPTYSPRGASGYAPPDALAIPVDALDTTAWAAHPRQAADAPEAALAAPTSSASPAANQAVPANRAAPAPTGPTKPKRRRVRWLWWTAGSLAFAALAGLCVYLAVVADQWSTRVDELTAISGDLGTQVADESAARKTAEAQAAELQSQLDTATSRITTLANEEANATDHESVWINLVDNLIVCADERQKLVDVLTNSRLYFPGTTNAQYEAELVAYCDGLKTEFADFRAEIGK